MRAPGCRGRRVRRSRFPTPSGRIELLSAEARTRWGLDELPTYREPRESLRGEEGDPARYPLSLLTPNTKNRIHSQFGNLPSIRALSPRPLAALHPADARARGIRAGDRVRVFNDRGSLDLHAELDLRPAARLRHGAQRLVAGRWRARSTCLSKARETDMGHGAAFHENLVEVERA